MKKLRWIYLASVLGFLALGIAYWYVALPKYEAKGEILIEDSEGGGGLAGMMGGSMGQMMKTFSVGGFGGAAVDNELLIIGSHDVVMRVVKSLQLNRTYTSRFDGTKYELWHESPIAIEAPQEYFDTLSRSYKVIVDILPSGNTDITVAKGMLSRTVAEFKNVSLPASLNTPLGTIQVLKTNAWADTPFKKIKVAVTGNNLACKGMMKGVYTDVVSKLGDAIEVDYKSPNRQKAIDVVNAVMNEYNLKRLDRSHERAREQVEYFDARIAELMTDLTASEKKEADFLSANGMLSTPESAALLAETAMTSGFKNVQAQQTLKYYEKVLDMLSADTDQSTVIPVIKDFSDANINAYNEAVMDKKDLEKSATPDNPAMLRCKERLSMLHDILVESSLKMVEAARNEIKAVGNVGASASSKFSAVPKNAMEYATLQRDKQLKNVLYGFLRQSREQAMLDLYSNSALGFVYEEAYADVKPNNMSKIVVVAVLMFLSLLLPTLLALLLMLRHKSVSDRMDLAKLGIEERSVTLDGSKAAINQLRALVMEHPQWKLLLFAGYGCSEDLVINSLAEAIAASDHKVTVPKACSDNDVLLTGRWQKEMAELCGANDYVLTGVPNADRLTELATLVDEHECQLIVCAGAGKVKVSELKRNLHGMPADKVSVAVVKNN